MDKERVDGCFLDEEADLLKLEFTDLFGRLKMVEMIRGQSQKVTADGYPINRFALGGFT